MMKQLIPVFVPLAILMFSSEVFAQCGKVYYAPAVAARPAYVAPATTYYAPPPNVAYRPANIVYRPAAPTSVAAPVVYRLPVYRNYSPYGGPEVRVPGQPILNTLRAIVP